MPIEVELPDGSIAEFPDGTADATIKTALAKYMQRTPTRTANANPFDEFDTKGGVGRFAVPILPEPPGMIEDVVKSAGAGLVRGAAGMVGLPGTVETLGRMGINAGAKALGYQPPVSPQNVIPNGGDVENAIKPLTGELYQPKTAMGRYARTIGEFAPGVVFPGGLAQKVLGNVVGPAVMSEAAGESTKGTALEPWARVGGALVGGHLANVPGRAYTPVATSAERQAAVRTLRNEGVTALSAGEVTGSKPLRYLEQHASDIPFSGGRSHAMSEQAGEQFTRAALRRAGIVADRATPDVIDTAFTQIGQRFDALAQASTARLNQPDAARMIAAMRNYERLTPPGNQSGAIRQFLNDIVQHAGNPIPGPVYARYRSQIEADARALQRSDPLAAETLRTIRTTLDDAVERGMPAAQRGDWREVRNHYRNMLVLERAISGAGENAALGLISPAALRTATKTLHGTRNYVRGNGDYSDLARSGVAVMSPLPNSGTPARLAAHSVGHAAGASIGALAGGVPGAALGAIAAPVGAGMLARGFMSARMQRYLGANARMQPPGIDGRTGGRLALPSAINSAARGPFVEVTIYPPGDPRNSR